LKNSADSATFQDPGCAGRRTPIWAAGFMKTILIVLFIILFIYLVVHMCAESGERRVPSRSGKGFEKSILVLNGLQSLDGKELTLLKDDLQDLKTILDAGQNYGENGIGRIGRQPVESYRTRSGKAILEKIFKELKKMDGRRFEVRVQGFSKLRVILVQIALIVITILMIVL
jgi:hypothetical protein